MLPWYLFQNAVWQQMSDCVCCSLLSSLTCGTVSSWRCGYGAVKVNITVSTVFLHSLDAGAVLFPERLFDICLCCLFFSKSNQSVLKSNSNSSVLHSKSNHAHANAHVYGMYPNAHSNDASEGLEFHTYIWIPSLVSEDILNLSSLLALERFDFSICGRCDNTKEENVIAL